nr:MAG TPA: hypothetical protein [Caudoviricetes sp.]
MHYTLNNLRESGDFLCSKKNFEIETLKVSVTETQQL